MARTDAQLSLQIGLDRVTDALQLSLNWLELGQAKLALQGVLDTATVEVRERLQALSLTTRMWLL